MIIWDLYRLIVTVISFVPYVLITFTVVLFVRNKREISLAKAIDVVNEEYNYNHELVMNIIFWIIAFIYYKK